MIYVYCKRGSDSARALSDAVDGKRLRVFDGMNFLKAGRKVKLQPGDCIIAWGEPVPPFEGVRVLNGVSLPNKYLVAKQLRDAGIATIEAIKNPINSKGLIGRSYNHVGGNDLLTPVARPDFWVRKLNIVEEYRIHSFLGKSIRAGKKIVREGYSLDKTAVDASNGTLKLASSWIRNFDGGWRICYDNFQSNKEMRKLAHSAVEALKLDFGAVDIGKLDDGSLIVLEVNRAPGLEGGSIDQYAKHVKDWVANASSRDEEAGTGVGESVQPNVGEAQPAPPAHADPMQPPPGYSFTLFNTGDGGNSVDSQTVEPAQPAAANPEPVQNAWTSLSNQSASLRPGRSSVFVQAARANAARQSVSPVGSAATAPGLSDEQRSPSATRLFDVQRRRITWAQWSNRINRISNPAVRARLIREAEQEARRGRTPYDPQV